MTESVVKTIVITGASGGVGRALFETYAQENVALCLVANAGADELRQDLARRQDAPALAAAQVFQSDLAAPDAAEALGSELLQTLRRDQRRETPRVDAFVAAAGIDLMTPESKARAFPERLQRAWQIDVASTVALARTLGAAMRAFRRAEPDAKDYDPGIVLFSWDGVERGMKGDTAQIYAACKGAVAAFGRSLAHDLAPDVRVNTVAPGWIKTTWGKTVATEKNDPYAAQSLLNRWGRPEEVARVVRFLTSNDAAYVNGQTIEINGGA